MLGATTKVKGKTAGKGTGTGAPGPITFGSKYEVGSKKWLSARFELFVKSKNPVVAKAAKTQLNFVNELCKTILNPYVIADVVNDSIKLLGTIGSAAPTRGNA